MLEGREVTVLGAGIGGLAAARALALRGARVTVLEQAEAIREIGAGIQISPNGARVLRALGLWEAFAAASVASEAVEILDGPGARPLARLAVGGRGEYRFVHRGRLIGVLAEGARAAGVQIRLLQQVRSVDLAGPRPRLRTAAGSESESDLLIGADGLHSVLRRAIDGPSVPFFTGQICWRALVPCAAEAPPVAQLFMGPGRHLVSYPLGQGLRNIVAVEERARWAEENYALQDDPRRLRAAFAGFGGPVPGWLAQVEAPWLWGLFRHPVARRWHDGRGAALLGDAAHPTLPFLAQGAGMALEDAWVLADRLAAAAPPEALGAYQAARAGRCARIVETASRNARRYHLSGLPRAVAHLGLRALSAARPGALLERFAWVHDHDVTAGE